MRARFASSTWDLALASISAAVPCAPRRAVLKLGSAASSVVICALRMPRAAIQKVVLHRAVPPNPWRLCTYSPDCSPPVPEFARSAPACPLPAIGGIRIETSAPSIAIGAWHCGLLQEARVDAGWFIAPGHGRPDRCTRTQVMLSGHNGELAVAVLHVDFVAVDGMPRWSRFFEARPIGPVAIISSIPGYRQRMILAERGIFLAELISRI